MDCHETTAFVAQNLKKNSLQIIGYFPMPVINYNYSNNLKVLFLYFILYYLSNYDNWIS